MDLIILVAVLALIAGLVLGYVFARQQQRQINRQQLELTTQSLQSGYALEISQLQQQLAIQTEQKTHSEQQLQQQQQQLEQTMLELGSLSTECATLKERVQQLSQHSQQLQQDSAQQLQQLQSNYQQAQQQQLELSSNLAQTKILLDAERRQGQEKLQLLENAKNQLSLQFKELANNILEEKSKSFLEQNQQHLGQILTPLNSKLQEFQAKVEYFYNDEGKQRAGMMQQIKQLMDLNQMLSKDAQNLTQALKGSAKTQGNWGEMILQRVLDLAGFTEGREYSLQLSLKQEQGNRVQPDVVIHLPNERHLIVDAKVSLVAYESFVQAQDDAELRQVEKERHLDSVRKHIKDLSSKNYQHLYGIDGIDFVLMFVPIEPAFMLAITDDSSLFNEAWEKNILLVSPSTLLFVVRTVAHLWRQEAQTANAYAIAKAGEKIYDELVNFMVDLEKVGERIKQAETSYNDALKKLAFKRGNVIKRAENLKNLGIKPTKQFSKQLNDQIALNNIADEDSDAAADLLAAANESNQD